MIRYPDNKYKWENSDRVGDNNKFKALTVCGKDGRVAIGHTMDGKMMKYSYNSKKWIDRTHEWRDSVYPDGDDKLSCGG